VLVALFVCCGNTGHFVQSCLRVQEIVLERTTTTTEES
jgi:hypothetical protein